MRKAALPVLLLLFTTSLALAVQDAGWVDYNSAEGRYTVSLPAQPKLSTQEAATADGQKFLQYMATAQEPNAIYLMGYFDHVPGTVFSITGARDGMVAAVKGTLISERTISLSGNPGLEMKVGTKSGEIEYTLLVKFYDTENRVYVQQLVYPKANESEALTRNAAKYFDSFQILKNK